ncbi:MAG: ATP-dependent Clp protease ATP-binding subunit ClpX, partial [Clostridia bacterium]|nr:ATP-dependent Clp protease ATP-binding subunit ClpX [Clostridia bacterium]
AFVGLDKIVSKRKSTSGLGFGADVVKTAEESYADMIKDVQPDDLIKYGLIPEFVGRVPIVVGLNALDEPALVKILTEPKNALTKQYKKLFDFDHVELDFDEEAISEVAKKAIALKTGARGLRCILEDVMLDVMYKIPGSEDVEKVIVTADAIKKIAPPTVVRKRTA